MKIQYEFVKREVAGENFLVPIGEAAKKFTGMFAMNEVGAFIWDNLPEAEDDEAIVKKLLEEYDVVPETAAADAKAFLDKLREMGIL